MAKVLGVLHTTSVTIAAINELAKRILPDVRVVNMLDDSLLADVITAEKVTPAVARRIATAVFNLEDAGAELILGACSSIGEALEAVQPFTPVPILRIDRPMAELAVREASRIGVLATVKTTLEPTIRLLEREARTIGKQLQIETRLCSEAFQALTAGDPQQHDELIKKAILELIDQKAELLVLAQASMARIITDLPSLKLPVLSSPPLALEYIKKLWVGGNRTDA